MKEIKLFLSWQAPSNRKWLPVGLLTFDGSIFRFTYTQGALIANETFGFMPPRTFPDLFQTYESDELFPLFANRRISPSRPEFEDFVQWLNIPKDKDDPLALLARSGGRRATDTFEVFPCPEIDSQGQYHIHFFSHGLRHLPDVSVNRIGKLSEGEKLYLAIDFQNEYDGRALILRTQDNHIVGYCPRYLLDDAYSLLDHSKEQEQMLEIVVERTNLAPAPLQFRLLCSLLRRFFCSLLRSLLCSNSFFSF